MKFTAKRANTADTCDQLDVHASSKHHAADGSKLLQACVKLIHFKPKLEKKKTQKKTREKNACLKQCLKPALNTSCFFSANPECNTPKFTRLALHVKN